MFRCVEHAEYIFEIFFKIHRSFIGCHSSRQEEAVLQCGSGTKRKPDSDRRRWWRERNSGHCKYRCYQWTDSHHRQSSRCALYQRAGKT